MTGDEFRAAAEKQKRAARRAAGLPDDPIIDDWFRAAFVVFMAVMIVGGVLRGIGLV